MKWTPIDFGPYRLDDAEFKVLRKPTLDDAAAIGAFLEALDHRTPWYRGQWFRHIRETFPDEYSQLLEAHGWSEATLAEYARVEQSVPKSRRIPDLPFNVHQAVASLGPAQQIEVLRRAKRDGLSLADVRQLVRKHRRREVAKGQAELAGRFRVVVADPDWLRQTVDDLVKVPVAAHLAKDAAVILRHPERVRFDIKRVLDAWQIEYKDTLIWNRVLGEPRAYLNHKHETILIAGRGKCLPEEPHPLQDSILTIRAEPGGPLPPQFRKLVERWYPEGSKLLLFPGDDEIPEGWTAYGRPEVRAIA